MAGFLVLAKSGLIASLRTCSITDQKKDADSVRQFPAKSRSMALVFSASSGVDQGSWPNVKLASAITMPALLVVFSMGNCPTSEEMTDIANFDFSWQYLIAFLLSSIGNMR